MCPPGSLDPPLLFSQPFRFESILRRRLRRLECFHGKAITTRVEKRTFSIVLLFQPSFSPPPKRSYTIGRSCNLFRGKKLRSLSSPPHFCWIIKRPENFAIIKKRREISLKNNLVAQGPFHPRTSRNSREKNARKRAFIRVQLLRAFGFIYSKGYCVFAQRRREHRQCVNDK